MALEIKESFEVAAPIDEVWAFINNPENVVACMPGASLKEIVDANQFIGAVKLKIGAVSAQYQGTITYVDRDERAHVVKMLAAGNERGGGTVSGTILTRLESLRSGRSTHIECESSIDLTGKIVQVGRGMIEGVSAQIIKKYVGNVRNLLEVPGDAATEATPDADTGAPYAQAATSTPIPRPVKEDSINVVAVVFKVMMDRIAGYFRRLFGRA
ncbi:MAG: SRPBCC family protein [Proteobacteria bacterium]|nr:SRPBCC family protein [Pseudomonadota bacterium]MBS0611036.1 SRPBCC family protein [Pseudomonadota bacterium]